MKKNIYAFVLLGSFILSSLAFAGGMSQPLPQDPKQELEDFENIEKEIEALEKKEDLSLTMEEAKIIVEEWEKELSQKFPDNYVEEVLEEEEVFLKNLQERLEEEKEVTLSPDLEIIQKEENVEFVLEEERIELEESDIETLSTPSTPDLEEEPAINVKGNQDGKISYAQVRSGDTLGVLMKTLTGTVNWKKLENQPPLLEGQYVWFDAQNNPVISDQEPFSDRVVITQIVRKDREKPEETALDPETSKEEELDDEKLQEEIEKIKRVKDVSYVQVEKGDTLGEIMKKLTGEIRWSKIVLQPPLLEGQYVWFDENLDVYISDRAPNDENLWVETVPEAEEIWYHIVQKGDTLGEIMKKLTGRIIWSKLANKPFIQEGEYVWFDSSYDVFISSTPPENGQRLLEGETRVAVESGEDEEEELKDLTQEMEDQLLERRNLSPDTDFEIDARLLEDVDVLIAYTRKNIEDLRSQTPFPYEEIMAQQKLLEVLLNLQKNQKEKPLEEEIKQVQEEKDLWNEGNAYLKEVLIWAIGLILLSLVIRFFWTRPKKK